MKKFRNNSVISSNNGVNTTFLSSEIFSQKNVQSPRIKELKKIKNNRYKPKDNDMSSFIGKNGGLTTTGTRSRHQKSVGHMSVGFEELSQFSPTCQSKLRMRKRKMDSISSGGRAFISSVRQTQRLSNLDKIYISAT